MGHNDHNSPADHIAGEPTIERVRRLSHNVRRSEEVHRDTLEARDVALVEAYAAGYTETQLAKAAGLSRQRVMVIVCEATTTEGAAS